MPACDMISNAGQCVLALQLHERFMPGSEAAFQRFLDDGCPSGARFEQVIKTGEYIVTCKLPATVTQEADLATDLSDAGLRSGGLVPATAHAA